MNLAGAVALTMSGGGAAELTGDDTFSGLATIIGSGTLGVGPHALIAAPG